MEIDPRVVAAIAAHQRCISFAIAVALRDDPNFMKTLLTACSGILAAHKASFGTEEQRTAFEREVKSIFDAADSLSMAIRADATTQRAD